MATTEGKRKGIKPVRKPKEAPIEDEFLDDDDDFLDDDDDEVTDFLEDEDDGTSSDEDDSAFVINMEDDVDVADADGPPPLEAGVYDFIIDDVAWQASQSSGNMMLVWKLRVIGGDYDGRSLMDYHVLYNVGGKNKGWNKQNLARTKKYIQTLKIECDMASFSPKEFANDGAAVGVRGRAKVNVTKDKSSGRKNNNVQAVLPSKGDGFL